MSHFRFCVTFPPAGNEGVIDSGSVIEMTTYYWMLRPCFSIYDRYTILSMQGVFIYTLDVKKLRLKLLCCLKISVMLHHACIIEKKVLLFLNITVP